MITNDGYNVNKIGSSEAHLVTKYSWEVFWYCNVHVDQVLPRQVTCRWPLVSEHGIHGEKQTFLCNK